MNTRKKRTRGAFWGLLAIGPLLLPAALALSPLLLIPLSLWVFLRGQHFWEQRRLAVQKRNNQNNIVFVHGQRKSVQGALLLNSGNVLARERQSQVLNLHGEFILLVFPSGEASRAKEFILSTLADTSGHVSKPEMIVLTR